MKIRCEVVKGGDVLLLVDFNDKDINFRKDNLTWAPRYEELDKIREAVKAADFLNQIVNRDKPSSEPDAL